MNDNVFMLKIAYINYLNSQPLYFGLEDKLAEICNEAGMVEILTDRPVAIAQNLLSSLVGAGQLSAYEYLKAKDKFKLHQNFCISSSTGKICSVLFLSKRPMNELNDHNVYLTDQSRTSVQLLRVLLKHKYGLNNRLISMPISLNDLLQGKLDNCLLIGDQALKAWQLRQEGHLPEYHASDLASEWFEWTGLPFVFAVFVSQLNVVFPPKLETLLEEHLQHNRHSIGAIVRANEGCGLSEDLMHEYFQLLDYKLDKNKEISLQKFYEMIQSLPSEEAVCESTVNREIHFYARLEK